MSDFSFKKAEIRDIGTLIEYRICFATEVLGKQLPEDILRLKEQLKCYFGKTINDNTSISFIARQGEEIAGIGTLVVREQPGGFKNLSGKWGYIMSMYTVPQFRRKGVCKRILNELTAEALKQGVSAFELHATETGEYVYLQEGFSRHDQPTYRKIISLQKSNG